MAADERDGQISLKVTTQRNASRQLTTQLMKVVTAAFSNDESFAWRYPNRLEHPEHHRHMFWRYLGAELLNPFVWVVVAYLRVRGEDVPVGYATWQMRGEGNWSALLEKERDSWLQSE
ncbi:hypothetical protein ABW20_dc0100792 [Dactylellina cionopaga]|nr:hypothetical protein ABW20_dc0100792 [Dactylellina cionopaga]